MEDFFVKKRLLLALTAFLLACTLVNAETLEERVDRLEKELRETKEELQKQIAEKYPFDKYIIISDREKAIRYGMRLLQKGDSLLIAGKGHETYQIIGNEKTHFDDREVVRKILAGK